MYLIYNQRKKKKQCKDNPSLEKCKKEDRPSDKNWKKATKENPVIEENKPGRL